MNTTKQKPLTQKQKTFVAEYLIDLNATQAAIRAGYSRKTAMEQGYQLLQKTSVYAAIQEAVDARAKRTQLTQDQVLNELVAIGFASLYDAFDIDNEKIVFKKIDELPANIQKSILEMTCVLTKDGTTKITRIKLACKIKALDMLYRHLAL